jgi:transposase
VDEIDLTPLRQAYRGVGSEAHPPELLLKMALWQLHDGRPSPARWARATATDIAMKWLGQGVCPSRAAWYAFRKRLGRALPQLNDAVVRQAIAAGLIDPRRAVLDGTAVRSQASRHHLYPHERLAKRREALEPAVCRDEAGLPQDKLPGWMARTPRGRRLQAQRYARASAVLQQRLTENARRPKDKRLDPRHVVLSVSDPEAMPGRDKEKVFAPLYTVCAFVEIDSLFVLATEVYPQASDARTLPAMLDRVEQVLGRHLDHAVVDSGFISIANLAACLQRGVTVFGPIQQNDGSDRRVSTTQVFPKTAFLWDEATQTYTCPQGHRLPLRKCQRKQRREGEVVALQVYGCPPEHCRGCPLGSRCARNPQKGRTITRQTGEALLEAHRTRMETAEAKELRRRRGSVIERAFGDFKEHRHQRRFCGRGLLSAQAQAGLIMLLLNGMNLERLRRDARNPKERGVKS